MKKLELNKEVLRDLSEIDLGEVSGGAADAAGPPTQTTACPSGATWLHECESYQILCL